MMRPFALALMSAFCFSALHAAETASRVFAALPGKTDPMIVLSFVWQNGKGLPDYREIAKKESDDPLTVWSKSQVAMDSGDLVALAGYHNAESKNDIAASIKNGDFKDKVEERKGLNIEISGIALMDDFAFVAYLLKSPKYGTFPWMDIVTGPSPWRLDSTIPANGPLTMAMASWSYAEHNGDLLTDLPKEGFNYGTLGLRSGLSPLKDFDKAMKTKSLVIGINAKSILNEVVNIDTYKGADKTIVFLREVSVKMRENKDDAFGKYFDYTRAPSNKNVYHLADADAGTRQSVIYAMHAEKELSYFVIGDDGGPRSLCIVHEASDGMKIIAGRPKSRIMIAPVFMESALVVDCVRTLKGN